MLVKYSQVPLIRLLRRTLKDRVRPPRMQTLLVLSKKLGGLGTGETVEPQNNVNFSWLGRSKLKHTFLEGIKHFQDVCFKN